MCGYIQNVQDTDMKAVAYIMHVVVIIVKYARAVTKMLYRQHISKIVISDHIESEMLLKAFQLLNHIVYITSRQN